MVILASVVAFFLMASGYTMLETENDQLNMWVPVDHPFKKNSDWLQKNKPESKVRNPRVKRLRKSPSCSRPRKENTPFGPFGTKGGIMRVANGGKFEMQLIIHSPTDTFQICRHLQPSLLCALTVLALAFISLCKEQIRVFGIKFELGFVI